MPQYECQITKALREAGYTKVNLRRLLGVSKLKIGKFLQHPENFSNIQLIMIAGLIGWKFEDVLFEVLRNHLKRKAMNERWYQVSEEVK